MSTISRGIYFYHLEFETKKGRKVPKNCSINSELNKVINYLLTKSPKNRKIDLSRQNKIIYLDSQSKVKGSSNLHLTFISAKYNQVREVIDTNTLNKRGKLKGPNDGDEELTHISIKCVDSNNAVLAFESNFYGIGVKKIVGYLDEIFQSYCKNKGYDLYGHFSCEIIPNTDFLESLAHVNRIKLATIVVDKTRLNTSDFSDLAERNDVRDSVEVVIKPKLRGGSIAKKTIKDYVKKKDGIKRIYVDCDIPNGSIRLDTEVMKSKTSIEVETNFEGIVVSQELFEQLDDLIENL